MSVQENHFKMNYRWHLPPTRIKKTFPQSTGSCWRCEMEGIGYLHMWWGCSNVKEFWRQVHDEKLQVITEVSLPFAPRVMLSCDFRGCNRVSGFKGGAGQHDCSSNYGVSEEVETIEATVHG